MIRKDKAALEIEKILALKKNLIPLLDKHIASSLPFSDIPGGDKRIILEKLREFVVTQSKHLTLLADMDLEMKGSREHVF